MRSWLLAVCICMGASGARADDMDLMLSRLRLPGVEGDCGSDYAVCPDDEAYERLVSELAVASAPQIGAAAHTVGPRGLAITLHQSVTELSSGELYWQRGTEGSSDDRDSDLNPSPASVLSWTRLEARKGLPLGLEVAAEVGHAWGTSMWAVGGRLKVALFEGFSQGVGALPDVALSVSTQGVVGAKELQLFLHGLELTLSKPYLVAGRFRVAPLVAGQMLFVVADSAAVDFAAGLDPVACDVAVGDACGQTLEGVFRFHSLRQLRMRWHVGVQLEMGNYRAFFLGAFEGPASGVASRGRAYGGSTLAAQFSLSGGLGIVL